LCQLTISNSAPSDWPAGASEPGPRVKQGIDADCDETMRVIEPYTKRSVTFLTQVDSEGWRVKVYGISANSEAVPAELVDEAIAQVLPQLPQPAVSEDRYGVGFLIIHQGKQRNWFLLDWWEHEDILFHRLFSSPLDSCRTISAEKSSATACVHELQVISLESEAWVKTVLGTDTEPDFDAYLKRRSDSPR